MGNDANLGYYAHTRNTCTGSYISKQIFGFRIVSCFSLYLSQIKKFNLCKF